MFVLKASEQKRLGIRLGGLLEPLHKSIALLLFGVIGKGIKLRADKVIGQILLGVVVVGIVMRIDVRCAIALRFHQACHAVA